MGTPDFAIPSLTLLLASDNTLAGIVTQPDRPKGRGKQLKPPPVKVLAKQHGLPIIQPEKVTDEDFTQWIKAQHPELIVVVAFGQILPPKVLRIPSHGCIN
ncbi:MAG: formyltransferase family protein, partial [Thermodesulfobacteriota bacterium]|nr:formyltransferase family protein [Thermodesulfobacteriota bacterium]